MNNNNHKSTDKTKVFVIAILSCTILLITMTFVLLTVLIKRYNKANSAKGNSAVTTETTTEDVSKITTEDVTTEATTMASTEAVTEAPAPVPFAEEKGFTWSDPYAGFDLSVYPYAYYYNEDFSAEVEYVTPEELNYEPTTAKYSFSDIEKSDPDENGNVTITIRYDVNIDVICTPYVNDKYALLYLDSCAFSFSDYYTGTKIEPGYVWDEECEEYDLSDDYNYTDINWNGQTIHIGVKVTKKYDYSEYTEIGDGSDKYSAHDLTIYDISFIIPADYDGLVLSIPKSGYTEEMEYSSESGDNTCVLGPDDYNLTYTPDQLYFIKVNDYIIQ
ncbi:MAG: hypothetical protein IJT72_00355 [Lachnospiraceae bacterium]|nr:hypothetical protein [Lachnospiraceae bacterium]